MITLSKVRSSTIEGGKRILKVLQFGTKTAKECGPFGFDSMPLENWTAIYSETSNKGDSVILGYINKAQLVTIVGEARVYSLAPDGSTGAFAFFRTDGSIELNGADFSGVRFEALNSVLQAQKGMINAELAKIAVSIGALGGSYTVAPLVLDLDPAKSITVKLK